MKSKQESCDRDDGTKNVESAEDEQSDMTRERDEEGRNELEADQASKSSMEEEGEVVVEEEESV